MNTVQELKWEQTDCGTALKIWAADDRKVKCNLDGSTYIFDGELEAFKNITKRMLSEGQWFVSTYK